MVEPSAVLTGVLETDFAASGAKSEERDEGQRRDDDTDPPDARTTTQTPDVPQTRGHLLGTLAQIPGPCPARTHPDHSTCPNSQAPVEPLPSQNTHQPTVHFLSLGPSDFHKIPEKPA